MSGRLVLSTLWLLGTLLAVLQPSLAFPPLARPTKLSFPCEYVIYTEEEARSFSVPIRIGNAPADDPLIKIVVTHSENVVWDFDVPPTPFFSDTIVTVAKFVTNNSIYCGAEATHLLKIDSVVSRLTRKISSWSFVMPGTYHLRAFAVGLDHQEVLSNTAETLIHIGHFPIDKLSHDMERKAKSRANDAEVKSRSGSAQFSGNPIAQRYQPYRLHNEIFEFKTDYLDTKFTEALESGDSNDVLNVLKRESHQSHLYSFQLFNTDFVKLFLEEIRHFEAVMTEAGVAITRPNSMNNFGAVLKEIGLSSLTDGLGQVILPLARLIFPEWPLNQFDSHHAFVVEYQIGKDEELDYHMDESLITVNICLGEEFEGGNVYFNGIRGSKFEKLENVEVPHAPGKAIIHVGQHWHGARKITSGKRTNLIVWFRNSEFYDSPSELLVRKLQRPNDSKMDL